MNIQLLYIYAKTEALRMLYLGRGSCLEENTRFLIDDVTRIECQIDMRLFGSAKIVAALFV